MWATVTESGDRAQMILVGALALAVTLVSIALVLNSAIYAENLATRANQEEPGRVTALTSQTVVGAGQSIEHLHRNDSSHSSYGELEDDFRRSIRVWASLNVRDTAREGRYIDAQYTNAPFVNGTRVAQTDGGPFEPYDDGLLDATSTLGGATSWVVADDVNRMRNYRMNISRSSLQDNTRADVEAYLGDLESSDVDATISSSAPLTLVYIQDYDADDTDSYTVDHSVAIYGDPSSDAVNITYREGITGPTYTCQVENPDEYVEIEVSAAEVEGADGECEEVFDFLESYGSEYQLSYVGGSNVRGNYSFVTDHTLNEFENSYADIIDGLDESELTDLLDILSFDNYYRPHNHADSDTEGPFLEPAIYSADVELTYRSDSVTFDRTVTVAPNEPE